MKICDGRYATEIMVHEGDAGIILDVYGIGDVTLFVWVNPDNNQIEIGEVTEVDLIIRAGGGPVALPVKIAIGVQHGVIAVRWEDRMISYSTNRSLEEREIAMTGITPEQWEKEAEEAQAARRAIREQWENEQHDAK